MTKIEYTKEDLLDVLEGYLNMIERDNGKYPSAVISDIAASINFVLEQNAADSPLF